MKRSASDFYNPKGIFRGNKLIISVKDISNVYSQIPLNKRIERITLHELWHVAGGNDDPTIQGIADPFLRYDPTEKEIEFIREKLRKRLYEI